MARKKDSNSSAIRPKVIAAAVAACFSLAPLATQANPTGPTVVSGSAAFAAQGNALTITNSHNAIINWRGFSISINELTRFMQPSAASAVLNRVIGSGGTIPQSVIDGILSSNGSVYLLNPNGIVFGPGATIDVAGLVASSLDISNQDFLNGRLRFMEVPNAGGVANHGIIETPSGGRVLLVAPDVENTGIIRSPEGEILLAAGKQVELVSEANPYVTVKVTADTESALNVGTLIADSGRIGMYGGVVSNTGVAAANGAVVGAGGQISFVATKDITLAAGSTVTANGASGGNVLLQAKGGTTRVEGTVEAKGTSGDGGVVDALGVRVGVIGNGVIDASGETGGGTVRVGGDYQGKNPSVQNAQQTTIGSDGVIRADAASSGDGGRVIVWADGDTAFHGSASVRGGSESGDGGFVETSGKGSLTVAGARLDASAPNGTAGSWLLDPTDYFIDATEAATIQSNFGSFGSVTVSSDGSVHYQSSLNLSYGSGGGAYRNFASDNINLNANSITTNGAFVELHANSAYGGPASGTGAITSSAPSSMTQIRTGGGDVDLQGASVTVAGIDSSAAGTWGDGGDVDIFASNGSLTTGSIATRGGPSGSTYGGWGGDVNFDAVYGTVSVNGSIDTRGAPGQPGTSTQQGGSGGWGGDVVIDAVSVNTGAIDTSGGAGAAGYSGAVASYGWIGEGGWGGAAGWVEISASGTASITTGSITGRGGNGGNGGNVTGDATGNSGFFLGAIGGNGGGGGGIFFDSNGAVTVNGAIDLSGGQGGAGGSASLTGNYGGSGTVFRQAYAWGGDGGEGGLVEIVGSSITTSSIATRSGDGGAGGSASVVVSESTATTVTANADAEGGFGGFRFFFVSEQSGVKLMSLGPVAVNGNIDAGGGNGAPGGTATVNASGTNVTSFNISCEDCDIARAAGGGGSPGGLVELAGSSVNAGSISVRSGNGANGGTATMIASFGSGPVSGYADADATGGPAVSYYGGSIPPHLFIVSSGAVTIGSVDARGGNAGNGGSASTSVSGGTASGLSAGAFASGGLFDEGSMEFFAGGHGGEVDIAGAAVTTTNISTQGGMGGNGGSANIATNIGGSIERDADIFGGDGGHGGPIAIASDGHIAPGAINTRGGNGGLLGAIALSGNTSGDTINAWGAHGGDGGSVFAYGGSIATGTIDTQGGNATAGGSGWEGGGGGYGGPIALVGSGAVEVGPEAMPELFATVIDASGGSGGAGSPPTSPAQPGGAGGPGGFVNLDGSAVNVNGIILSAGGAGGDGFPGGNGGDGGALTLATTGGSGIITFTNGGWEILGGAGGPGAFGGLAGIAGSAGIVDVFGTLVFIILDPLLIPEIQAALLAIPEVEAAIQQGIDSSNKSVIFPELNRDDDEEDKLGKKGTAVCKPRSA